MRDEPRSTPQMLNEIHNLEAHHQISIYRLKRLEQQAKLHQMEEEEEQERRILNDKRAKERLAYEKTRNFLISLKNKIASMKKRNAREAALDKKIKFLVCNDFQKWTNSFARKSVMWDPKKQKLMRTNAIVDEIIDGDSTKANPLNETCCGK